MHDTGPVLTPREARQAKRGTRTLVILAVSLTLALVGMALSTGWNAEPAVILGQNVIG